MKVIHIITGLAVGGAETMLCKLLAGMDRSRFELEVISLSDKGPLSERIEALGIPVRALGMRPSRPNPAHVLKLARWLRASHPDVVQTWMYHADLIGGLAARLAGRTPLVWNIRHSDLSPGSIKRATILIGKTCARLSRRLPARIACCSEAGLREHVRLGYMAEKFLVIPNGFDLNAYKPDAAARSSVRQELGLAEETPLIGHVGRFDPQKDHRNFIKAAGLLHTLLPEVHFLLCGTGVQPDNNVLRGWISGEGLEDRCHLLGRRSDIPRLSAALDIAASSSSDGEGFSNVLGEAMACGIPCVATDVGDSALIVGDTGRIVAPRDAAALAAALQEMLALPAAERAQLGKTARHRVETHFSLPAIARRYEELYQELASLCAA